MYANNCCENLESLEEGLCQGPAMLRIRFALSSMDAWADHDGQFDMIEFYWNIVRLFIDDSPWARNTLSWWNIQIFGLPSDQHCCFTRFIGREASSTTSGKDASGDIT
ncbi:hypothetical protein DENSPDRAFT_851549 [Dentipellis sp. KUC8613]|nr:hypothetical protein DENSPDRAFT_851549 [Dentipellis sp. KUC8613]